MFVPAVLCVLLGLAVPHVSAYGEAPGTDGGSLGAQGAGAEVAKLYEEAADATRRYEEGRRQAGIQRAEASELERRWRRNGAVSRSCTPTSGGSPVPSTAPGAMSRTPPGCCWPTAPRT